VSLANLSTGQLQAHTLEALRKLHQVVTFPGGSLPVESDQRMDFEVAWSLRTKRAQEILAEWDRRLPLMTQEARESVKGGKVS
jgi:hypothetical protein